MYKTRAFTGPLVWQGACKPPRRVRYLKAVHPSHVTNISNDASGDFNRKYKPKGGRFAPIYDFLMIVICFYATNNFLDTTDLLYTIILFHSPLPEPSVWRPIMQLDQFHCAQEGHQPITLHSEAISTKQKPILVDRVQELSMWYVQSTIAPLGVGQWFSNGGSQVCSHSTEGGGGMLTMLMCIVRIA